jgi:hypothetical protein
MGFSTWRRLLPATKTPFTTVVEESIDFIHRSFLGVAAAAAADDDDASLGDSSSWLTEPLFCPKVLLLLLLLLRAP